MRNAVIGMCVLFGGLGLAACGGGDDTASSVPDYAAVSAILGGPEQSGLGACSASICHGGESAGKAGLNFKTAKNLVEVLVDVPACENKAMVRIKPGDPEHSWLWIKLNADIVDTKDGQIKFDGTPSACVGVASKDGYGTRMPQAFGSFKKMPEEDLTTIYDWIKGGAPGPKD